MQFYVHEHSNIYSLNMTTIEEGTRQKSPVQM